MAAVLQKVAARRAGVRVGATVVATSFALAVSQLAMTTMASAAGCGYGASGCTPPRHHHDPKQHGRHGHHSRPHSHPGPIHYHHVVGHVLHGVIHILAHGGHGH